jgi:hypothetical protein
MLVRVEIAEPPATGELRRTVLGVQRCAKCIDARPTDGGTGLPGEAVGGD